MRHPAPPTSPCYRVGIAQHLEPGSQWAYSVAMKIGIAIAVLSVSLLAVNSVAQNEGAAGASSSQVSRHEKGSTKPAVEYEIAGLRPGKDTIEKAYRRFHKDRVIKELSPPSSALWMDNCNHQMLTVGFDPKGVIREVRIEPAPVSNVDCSPRSYDRSTRARMGGTRRGLVFRDSCDRIQQIYGVPQSQAPTVNGGQEFTYRFDPGEQGKNMLSLALTCNPARNDVESIKLAISDAVKP
jgi:hypothetical protein